MHGVKIERMGGAGQAHHSTDKRGFKLMDELLSFRPLGGGRYAFEVPEGWLQGRGLFGGIIVAILIRAIEAEQADETRPLRSLTCEIVAPVLPGPALLVVDALRQGSGLSCFRAVLEQGGQVMAHAVGVLAKRRPAPMAWQNLSPPAAPDWQTLPLTPMAAVGIPECAQRFDFRFVSGAPYAGPGVSPEVIGYVNTRLPWKRRDASTAGLLIDAWWSAAIVPMTTRRPIATIAFSLDLIGDFEGLPPDAPLLHRGIAPVAWDGYVSEDRELWGVDGRLIARNHQVVAVIA